MVGLLQQADVKLGSLSFSTFSTDAAEEPEESTQARKVLDKNQSESDPLLAEFDRRDVEPTDFGNRSCGRPGRLTRWGRTRFKEPLHFRYPRADSHRHTVSCRGLIDRPCEHDLAARVADDQPRLVATAKPYLVVGILS